MHETKDKHFFDVLKETIDKKSNLGKMFIMVGYTQELEIPPYQETKTTQTNILMRAQRVTCI